MFSSVWEVCRVFLFVSLFSCWVVLWVFLFVCLFFALCHTETKWNYMKETEVAHLIEKKV